MTVLDKKMTCTLNFFKKLCVLKDYAQKDQESALRKIFVSSTRLSKFEPFDELALW